jgi:putative transposase
MRDRHSSFEPQVVPKRQAPGGRLSDMIISLRARGMTIRDHLECTPGTELSHETISPTSPRRVAEEGQGLGRPGLCAGSTLLHRFTDGEGPRQ